MSKTHPQSAFGHFLDGMERYGKVKIIENEYNPFEPKDTIAFVRIKDDCGRFLTNKNHEVIYYSIMRGYAIIKMSRYLYDIHRSWLLKTKVMSCITEIQEIKFKTK